MKRSLPQAGRSVALSFRSRPRRQPSRNPSGRAFYNSSSACTEPDDVDDKLTTVKVSHYSTSRARNVACWSAEKKQATRLVDWLMRETDHLMRQSNSQSKIIPSSLQHHLIAFSGGIDSSLVAALVHQQGRGNESVRAILGISTAVPAEQISLARSIAQHIGIPLQEVETREGSNANYIANQGQACLACKTHLYATLQAIIHHVDNDTPNSISLYNGTNADDLQDPTRLGLIAANRFRVLSPLREITKAQVRLAARHLGLPNWNAAASPCLRSRLALGVEATREHLQLIERAERFVRRELSSCLETSTNLRVRLLAQNRACIEVDDKLLDVVRNVDWEDYFVGQLEFASVQTRAFRSGSVAAK